MQRLLTAYEHACMSEHTYDTSSYAHHEQSKGNVQLLSNLGTRYPTWLHDRLPVTTHRWLCPYGRMIHHLNGDVRNRDYMHECGVRCAGPCVVHGLCHASVCELVY